MRVDVYINKLAKYINKYIFQTVLAELINFLRYFFILHVQKLKETKLTSVAVFIIKNIDSTGNIVVQVRIL